MSTSNCTCATTSSLCAAQSSSNFQLVRVVVVVVFRSFACLSRANQRWCTQVARVCVTAVLSAKHTHSTTHDRVRAVPLTHTHTPSCKCARSRLVTSSCIVPSRIHPYLDFTVEVCVLSVCVCVNVYVVLRSYVCASAYEYSTSTRTYSAVLFLSRLGVRLLLLP